MELFSTAGVTGFTKMATEEANKAYSGQDSGNESGVARLAHISMTEAVAFDPKTHDPNKPEQWPVLKAEDYKKDSHGHMQFFCSCCLDKGNKVQLRRPSTGSDPKGGYFQNIPFDLINRESGEPVLDAETKKPKIETRRYYFPPHFSTMPGQQHVCEAARHQQDLALSVQQMGGTTFNSKYGVRSLSLVIPAGQKVIEPKNRSVLSEEGGGNFNKLSSQGDEVVRRIHRSNRQDYQRREGVRSAEDLGVLLTHTEFSKDQRNKIILRNGEQTVSLARLYHSNPVDMHEQLLAKESEFFSDTGGGVSRHTSAFSCKLGNSKKGWIKEHDGSTSIRIEAERPMSDGHMQSASVKINFQSPEAERQFRKAFDSGERDFLFFSENTFIKQDKSAVKMTIFTPQQFSPWKPPSPQLQLDLGKRPSVSDQPDDGLHPH